MRSVIVLAALAACLSAFAVTATKEWVQKATNDVLRQAMAYADAKPAQPFVTDGTNTISADGSVVRENGLDVTLNGVASRAMWTGRYWRITFNHADYGYAKYDSMYRPDIGEDADVIVFDLDEGSWDHWPDTFSHVRRSVDVMAKVSDIDGAVGDISSAVDRMSTTVMVATGRVDSLSQTVGAWQTYWDGDDVRVTVTNYYGSLGLPGLYLEQKMPADGEHAEKWFKVVWDERTRWNEFLSGYESVTNRIENDLADRAWGVYDSSTGGFSPDGLLQLSQDEIMISGGMSWQKTVTAGGCACWILKATTPTTFSGRLEDGFFRILDADGSPLFEIVKGDKRIVPATASDLSVDGGVMTVRYNVEAAEHPTMEVCTDLKAAAWQAEDAATVARVSWSGSSGAWVATVTPVGAPRSMFARATYEAGGNTYIRNHVAVSTDRVVIGGIEYAVTVETVNGKKLMVLK